MSRIITFAKRNRQELKRFTKFMFVGGLGAIIDGGALNLLAHGLHANLLIAGTISFTLAVTSNFLWNRYWTYPESRAFPPFPQYIQFVIINAMALAIRLPILNFLPSPLATIIEPILHTTPDMTEVLANNGAWAMAVAIAMFWNFFINRLVTYRHVKVG
jgi:putative flippase GtrA